MKIRRITEADSYVREGKKSKRVKKFIIIT